MRVILTGVTGMVGEGVLLECLENDSVEKVLAVSRKPTDHTHPKLEQLLVPDFRKTTDVEAKLTGYDACFYCAGVSSVGMSEADYTAISYDIYKGNPKDVDLDAVTTGDQKRYSHTVPLPGSHLYASFGHLAGYSSAYYTYLWDKVIAEDLFQQFDTANLLGGTAAMRYRRAVLETGGSVPANDLVKDFLGRPQNMQAFQKWMAEEFPSEPRP